MMEGIQSDKSHLLPSSVTGLDCGKGGEKNLILLSLGMQKTKQPDLIIGLQTTSQLTGSGSVQQGVMKRLSSAGQEVLVILEHQKCKSQRLNPNLSSTSALADKIRVGVWSLDGKKVRPVWNCFHMANTCFHAHSPGLEHFLPPPFPHWMLPHTI